MAGGRTSPARAQAAERQRQALELRRSGLTYDVIAERLGYSDPRGAHKAVEAALKRTLQEPAAEVRRVEVDRLDKMLTVWWEKAAAGDEDAAAVVLKIMARRAKLLGLDAPKSLELTLPPGTSIPIKVIEVVREIRTVGGPE